MLFSIPLTVTGLMYQLQLLHLPSNSLHLNLIKLSLFFSVFLKSMYFQPIETIRKKEGFSEVWDFLSWVQLGLLVNVNGLSEYQKHEPNRRKWLYFHRPPENPFSCSQVHLHLGPDAHLPPGWLIPFQHRNVSQSYDKSRLGPLSLKCQAIEMEKGKLQKMISTQPEQMPCTMDAIHATTKMFMYLPKQNRTKNLEEQMQFTCSFAL